MPNWIQLQKTLIMVFEAVDVTAVTKGDTIAEAGTEAMITVVKG